MKKVIIICTKYHHSDGSSWLVSELANSIANKGCDVNVVNLDWNYSENNEANNEINFLNLLPFNFVGRWESVGKWLFSSFKILPIYFKFYREKNKFDLLINFSPCASTWLPIFFQKLITKNSLLIYWDFFPIHNQQIASKIPAYLMPGLKSIENFLVNMFLNILSLKTYIEVDLVFLILQENIFLQKYSASFLY